jgi:hypothetical protein
VSRRTFISIETTASQAETLASQGRWAEAERHYRELISQTHVIDYEYDDWLRRLAELYRHLGRLREAGLVYLYLHYFDLARAQLAGDGEAALRGRLLEVEKRYAEAAGQYAAAGLPAHAAVMLEKAGEHAGAVTAWEALLAHPGLRGRDYEHALVAFDYGMAAIRVDPASPAARKALVDSQRRLEQVADDFESRGELERAFDCFQILLKLGRDSGQFENLAEGYVNCIRVLREDGLKFYVLQYYEDFIRLALERGELQAAATLYQEAAEYAVRAGLPYDRRYRALAADTWTRCARRYAESGAPVELVENAWLAAVAQFSSVGDYQGVRTVFEQLSALELPERQRRRFDHIARRYAGVTDEPVDAPAFPDYLKQAHAYADIWFLDVLEWELAGDPFAVAASMVGDLRYPNGIRRRALVVLLNLADAQRRDAASEPATLAELAELLGELQSYAALAPLEKLAAHADPQVRRAAVRALRFLYFKRSFVIVRAALQDADAQVREAALVAIAGLHFPHAFNPLSRIYREARDPRVQVAALEAIGKIQTVEAGELLVMVLRQEDGPLREVARAALAQLDNADVLPILRQHHEVETNPRVRELLGELLRRA